MGLFGGKIFSSLSYFVFITTSHHFHSQHNPLASPVIIMPFTDSCRNVRLEGSILKADCRKTNDTYVASTINLDSIIGSIEGKLSWGHQAFSKMARNVKLEGSKLSAEMQKTGGVWVSSILDLNTNIANKDGVLGGVNIPIVDRSKTPTKPYVYLVQWLICQTLI